MPASSFKARAQHETNGTKLGSAIKFQDAERRKCSKLVVPHMQRLTELVGAFKDKCALGVGNYTMWHLQLKMSKELVRISCSMLGFLDLVADFEELASDAPKVIIPLIDSMIDECQDAILDTPLEEKWEPVESRDTKTKQMLDSAVGQMGKVVEMVFKSKFWIKTEERYEIMHLCRVLFEAADDLVESATYDGDFLELDCELDDSLKDAVSKCDDQTLDDYLDVDCENEDDDE
uniref:Uncharacterized protein n=1 Tax=Cryptomonas curvata TaxID=233186 RepID=A0A7S0MDE9_9CRYP|mmetsp:Transcript_35819/g.74955  ORF Transcript_35819/g.74955 Transcript_35819/m.74955 type:complete len:233 (+) Transcript_35819:64-762(+)